MTLVELLVAMGIFVTVIAVFMSGIVIMTKDTARAAGVSDATTTARKVLDRFDKQVRYSSGINGPGTGSDGAYYVEYLIPSQTAGAPRICVQWRYDPTARTLSQRSWSSSGAPTPAPTWNTIATDVRNAVATDPPFVFSRAGVTQLHQELTVSLDIGAASRPGAQVTTTYVARNTTQDTATNIVGNTVCQTGVGRP